MTVATLPSGLLMVHRHCAGATEFCGVTAGVGSRDELTPGRYGLAHFVEHTLFKGTSRRSDSYVLNRMEAVGGELNAYTTKEETSVYSAMPAGNYRRATALIAELVIDSQFPSRRIDREREVICDEIDSYLDSPADGVFDLFDEMVFAGNPLAHNILGTKESVAAIDSDVCRGFMRSHFTADNMVYFYLGPERPDRVFRAVGRAFEGLPAHGAPKSRVAPSLCAPCVDVQDGGAHQSHTVMGALIGGLHAPDRFDTALAINILGGPGMNSLLNVALRERRGLVYTVDASSSLYSDCGLMTVYFGCDHEDTALCTRLSSNVLDSLASSRLTPRRLDACKRQFLGQVTLGGDNKEQLALSTARAVLHGLMPPSLAVTSERINAVTPESLRDAAVRLAEAPLRRLTLK